MTELSVEGSLQDITASRALMLVRQGGTLVQYDSGAGVGANLKSLTLGGSF